MSSGLIGLAARLAVRSACLPSAPEADETVFAWASAAPRRLWFKPRPTDCRYRHARWRGVGFVIALPLSMLSFLYSAGALAQTVVTPDGRTQTSVTSAAGAMNVTTSTIQNGNAYNSFSQFRVGQGDTVNLHVPDAAQRLLNVVHDGPVNVDGVLNSYKSGKIGGDVYFADPYGFMVGKTGSVNVGSLTVRTPTKDAAQKLIDAQGNVNAQATSDLVNNITPISPDGSVVIKGRINAPDGVHLTGQSVVTANSAHIVTGGAAQKIFDATVNTSGLQQSGGIAVHNGVIEITAAGAASVDGTLRADAVDANPAGQVTVATGGDIELAGTARISAKGNGAASNGGKVKLLAGGNLSTVPGAAIDVSAGSSGDGGEIELSAAGAANISTVVLNAGAVSGHAGAIIIDPTDVTIGNVTDLSLPSGHASIISNGGNVSITASNSITLTSGAFINTRQIGASPATTDDVTTASTGKAGDVSLSAHHITIDGKIHAYAGTNNSNDIPTATSNFASGKVTLTASDANHVQQGDTSITTTIDISGTIQGGAIDVEANAIASSHLDTLEQVAASLITTAFGAGGGYVSADAYATINVKSGAKVYGASDVTFNSWTDTTAEDLIFIGPVSGITGSPGIAPSVMIGNVTGKATTAVAAGSAVTSGGKLTVRAHNTADLDVALLTFTTNTPIDASVAYTTADVESSATVDAAATIKAHDIQVTARNDNKFSTSVSVLDLGDGNAGIAAAIADGHTSKATADFGASVNLAGSLAVEADSFTSVDKVSASTTTGANAIQRGLTKAIPGAGAQTKSKFTEALGKITQNLTLIKFGSALSLTLGNTQSSSATLGKSAANAPTVTAKSVSVIANTSDGGVRSNGDSAVNSPKVKDVDDANPTAQVAISAGIALADRTLSATAAIGAGAVVTAPNIAILSDVTLPVTITWLDGDSFSAVVSHINGNLGVANNILTSFTSATADASALGISGAVNIMKITANSYALVGEGAVLKSVTPSAAPWTVKRDSGDDASWGVTGATDQTIDTAIDIAAHRSLSTINFGGNIGIFLNGIGGSDPDAKSVGASYLDLTYGGSTVAAVGAQASVTSEGKLNNDNTMSGGGSIAISAAADDKAIVVSPAGGRGGGLAVSGMYAAFTLDSKVHASVDNTAKLSATNAALPTPPATLSGSLPPAPTISVTATQGENIGTVAGSIIVGNENSVGGMYTQNTIKTDVKAYVGDNSADYAWESYTGIANFTAPSAGVTAAGAFNLSASESGIVQSLAVSVDAGENNALGAAIAVSSISDGVTATLDGATVRAKDVYLNAHADDTIQTIAMGVAVSTSGGVAGTGSAASATISPTVAASIKNGSDVIAANNVGVLAFNDDEIDTIAGAAGFSNGGAGVGISVVVSQISGDTSATISGSNTKVDANGGDASDSDAGDPNDILSINSGILASAPDTSSISAPTATAPSLAETQKTVRGLAVVANSHQAVVANAVTLGVGKDVGAAIVPVTTIIKGKSRATITDADIDTRLWGNPKVAGYFAPQVEVIASNHSYTGDFIAAIAGGDLAGAGAASGVRFEGTTLASVADATIGTDNDEGTVVGAVDIGAQSTQAAAVIVLGGAGGMNAGAASLAVTLFSANTDAHLIGGSTLARSLTVGATSSNGINVLAGAAAIGNVGIGGSIIVTINNGTTLGYVGDMTNVLNGGTFDDTELTIGTAALSATTNNDIRTLAIAGAGAATVGVAAMADVTTMSGTTRSGFYDTVINQAPATKAGNISVDAKENDSVTSKVGGGATGLGAAVGVAANVVVLHAEVTASILDSEINSSGTVHVGAEGNRDIDAQTYTGTISGAAGVSASIGVVLAGTNASSDVAGELDSGGSGTLSNVNSLSNGASGNPINSGSPDAITASIAGSDVTAKTVDLTATGKTATSNRAIGVAAGGFAGVGGAVAYSDIGSTVVTSLSNSTTVASSVSLVAQSLDNGDHALSTEAEAGGGGLVGIGAGVSIAKMDNHVGAQIVGGRVTGDGTGDLTVRATDTTSGDSISAGGAAGGVAVGVMVATAEKNSHVDSNTQTSATLEKFGNITFKAEGGGTLSSSATGVSGGTAAAANAAAATATDNAFVRARLGDSTSITGNTGLVSVLATNTPQASASAYGVAVSDGAALGVSVATVSISPHVLATAGDQVSVSGAGGLKLAATLAPVQGQYTADSSAFAGAGGSVIALNGAVAISTNHADVEATTGTNLTLPGGDISVLASDTSSQNAYASGIGVGGIAGGASFSNAVADATTKATLGSYADTDDVRTGSLTVSAVGVDTDTAHSAAGTYGLVAGNASISQTDNNSIVTATIGAGTDLFASSVTLKATHLDNWAQFGDSTQVSVLGASGAGGIHNANVTVKAEIQNDVQLVSATNIDVEARNDFVRVGTGDSADAGGGGVLNGAGATSETQITGSSIVEIDSDVLLVAGNDPVSNPGSINLLADSTVSANDVVSLSTGGVLQGAGTANDFTANLSNSVTLDAGVEALAFGNINIGTFTVTQVVAKSLGSTWGILGAVADATADVDLTATQTVSLAGGTKLQAYGNINVTPGQNPADGRGTDMSGGAQAETYVSGFIAIPAAYAESDITNNTALTIASGATIRAGQNVNLGSYTGNLAPHTDGTGHGYELGFIPVIDGSGTDNANAHFTATAAIDGDVTAGAFHDIAINVADCQDTGGFYCRPFTITGGFTDAFAYEPVGAFITGFSPPAFIGKYISGTDAALLVQGVSSSAVDALALNTLFASGGSVNIAAGSVTGSGTLTANGEASITVNNLSPDYLVLGKIKIADNPGGHVFISGGASKESVIAAGMVISANSPSGAPGGGSRTVEITNAFTDPVGTSNLGPAIFVTGSIENLGGSVHIAAPFGSLGQFSPIVAQNVVIDVPQGVLLVDLSPGLLESTGPSPIAAWAPYMIMPGGNPAAGTPSADDAIAYAVNAVYNPNGTYTTPDALSTALYNTTDGKGGHGATILVYGNCLPTRSGNKCQNGNSTGPTGQYWDLDHFPGFGDGRSIADVANKTLSYSTNTLPPSSGVSAITANAISIHATTININSDVIAGTPTSWSVYIPSTVQSQINSAQSGTKVGTSTLLTGVSKNATGDSQIKVSYVTGATAADGRIVVDNVLASSPIAASIKLNGNIISTSAGHIHVNAGLGQVTINNQTSTAVTVNNVSAGNSARLGGLSGTLEIIDPLKAPTGTQHWWYVYTPGQGTDIYTSSDPNATLGQATLSSSSAAGSFTYNPLSGMRYEWQQTAFLSRTVTFSPDFDTNPTTTAWQFTNPNGVPLGLNANQPWYYTDTYAPDNALYTQDPAHAGRLLFNQGSGPLLRETITGTTTITDVNTVNASCMFTSAHCFGGSRSTDFSTFVSASGFFFGIPTGLWDFDYITKGTVTVTTSVKADNPIAIDFSGSTRGAVNIISNAPVIIGGQIANPDGDTVISTAHGNISTTVNGSITSNNLDLTATDGAIGSASNPLATTQVNDGVLNASGKQGVFISANSAVNIGSLVAANGDVALTAKGDINAVGTPTIAAIAGVNADLTAAQGGGIGPITTQVTGTLNATADGAISIEQLQGNLSAGSIKSLGIGGVPQAVTITVDHGALLDAGRTTAIRNISDDDLQSIWTTLKLTAQLGAAANTGSQSTTVTAVTNSINSDYQQYWLLLQHGHGDGATFQLNAGADVFYQSVAAASGQTAQQYAQGLYSKVVSDFAQYIGADWQSTADFQARNTHFSFTPSSTQISDLNQNAVWTEGQLRSALSITALQPSTITSLGSGTPNVSGAALDLATANGIGSLAAPVFIDINRLKSGNLVADEQRAIALAKNPGDITFVGVDGSGSTVRFGIAKAPDGSLLAPNGVTITGVEIRQTAPLLVNAQGTLNALTAQGGIFLQSTGPDLKLGLVDAGTGEISLAAPRDIVAADASSPFVLKGGRISLLAGAGDLGKAGTALSYKGTEIASASAGRNVYLKAFDGNLVVDRLFAGRDASLDAPNGGIQAGLDGIALISTNLSLHAGHGDIGSIARPFQFQLTGSGALQGNAQGAAILADAGSLRISSFTAGSDLAVTATGNLTAGPLHAGGNLSVNAGGDLSLILADSAGSMNIVAGGDADIANLTAAGDLFVIAGSDLAAAQLISITGNLGAQAGGKLSLNHAAAAKAAKVQAGTADVTNLATGSDLAVITTANLSAGQLHVGGNLFLIAGDDLSLTLADSAGVATIVVSDDAQIANLTAAGDLFATASGDLTAVQLTSGNGNLSVTAAGDLTATQLASSNGNLFAVAGGKLSLKHAASKKAANVQANNGAADVTDLVAGGDLSIGSGGALAVDQVSSGAKLAVNSGGNLLLGTATAAGTAQVAAKGNAGISNLTAAGDMTLTATGDLNAGKIASTNGNMAANAGANLNLGQATAGGTLQVTASGAAVIGQLQSAFAGDHAISLSADTISGSGTSLANLMAPGKSYLNARHGIGTASLYLSVSLPALQAATTSGSVFIHALTDMSLDDINVSAILGILADHNLTFGNIQAGQSATLSAGNALTGNSLQTGGLATLTAGPGSIQLAHLLASDAVLVSGGDLSLNDVTIVGRLAMTAPNVAAKITQSGGSGPLQISIGGLNGGPASSSTLSIAAPNGVTFSSYSVINGTVLTTASLVDFQQAFVSGELLLVTPATDLYMNNQSTKPVKNVTEQFYAAGKTFFLKQDGKNTRTNAFALAFGDGFAVTTVDAQGNSRAGVNLVQDAPLPLTSTTWATVYASQQTPANLDAIYTLSVQQGVPALALVQQWVSGVESGGAVNTDAQ